MSDDAINHNIRLTVKDGTCYVTMDFKGLKVGTSFGYLGTLKYFISGYTLDSYGAPQGDVKEVAVDSVQKNADGSAVKDESYNSERKQTCVLVFLKRDFYNS